MSRGYYNSLQRGSRDNFEWNESAENASSFPRALCENTGVQHDSNIIQGNNSGTDNNPPAIINLEELSLKDPSEMISALSDNIPFFLLLERPHLKPNNYALIVKILAAICHNCSCDERKKVQLLVKICNTNFLNSLRKYILNLPNANGVDKINNSMFWNSIEDFWVNFVKFSHSLINISHTTACEKLASLLPIARDCVHRLQQNQENIKAIIIHHLEDLEMALPEDGIENEFRFRKGCMEESLEDFYNVPVIPTSSDIMIMPQNRQSTSHGYYENVGQYLNIQFKLLREDLFSPIRDKIYEYLDLKNRRAQGIVKRHNKVRFYESVQFVRSTFAGHQIGVVVDLRAAFRAESNLQNGPWEASNRFMLGSVVLFTRDNFKNLIFGLINQRNNKQLQNGFLSVTICNEYDQPNVKFQNDYIMAEVEIYFEPYYYIQKVLKMPCLKKNFPFVDYIVKQKSADTKPQYLNESIEFKFRLENGSILAVKNILDIENWPTSDDMGLDASQYEAFRLALLREFTVIKGFPGTGKTLLALRITEVLLKNIHFKDSPMLVVCHTNDTLDRFLQGILKFSKNFIRIGGPTKISPLDDYNLINVRSNYIFDMDAFNALRDVRGKKTNCLNKILKLEKDLNSIVQKEFLVGFQTVCQFVPDLEEYLGEYVGKANIDPILLWLLDCCEDNNLTEKKSSLREKIIHDNLEEISHTELQENDNKGNNEIYKHFKNYLSVDDSDNVMVMDINQPSQFVKSYQLTDENEHIMNLYEKLLEIQQAPQNENTKTSQLDLQNYLSERLAIFDYISDNLYNCKSSIVQFNKNANLLTAQQRWSLYNHWIDEIIENKSNRLSILERKYGKYHNVYEEFRMVYDAELLKHFELIAITTAAAARLKPEIDSLSSTVVIVEEAAEILESHLVVSLTEHCQQLILIGDDIQGQPPTKGSLFERLITNGMPCCTLKVQHRMRPEIAQLIAPSIYEELENHESVSLFPNVRGMKTNVFFLNHSHYEEKIVSGRLNRHEADFLIKLARYLMQQGYKAEDITILTTYPAQMLYLMDKRKEHRILKDVRVTKVNNFQGDESRIILLSLVRSNPEGKIGYLKVQNRICAAFSRAKEGFYIIGNMSNLTKKSDFWTNINKTLTDKSAIGTTMTLQCENHKDVFTKVCTASDFEQIAEGGCTRMCDIERPCGHACPSICHAADHTHYKCMEKCSRILCKRLHDCPLLCWMNCEPCKVEIEKTLPCNHVQMTPCHIKAKDFVCQAKVSVVLEDCEHKAEKGCNQPIDAITCQSPCEDRLPCGHTCIQKCHKHDDPDHINYRCSKVCGKKMFKCTEDHICPKNCYEKCEECSVEVLKHRKTCDHMEKVLCPVDIDETVCMAICNKILECGHPCKRKCFERCGGCAELVKKKTKYCEHDVDGVVCGGEEIAGYKPPRCNVLAKHTLPSPCGHTFLIPCYFKRLICLPESEAMLRYCNTNCNEDLMCGHRCAGNCKACFQGRIHIPCQEKCNRRLICGHFCEVPCSQACPPCKKRCNLRCAHNKCSKTCGEICAPCIENCTLRCEHSLNMCGKKCWEQCSQKPCVEKCPLFLKCDHPCTGFCGETCPDACYICDPDNFPTSFLMKDPENMRLIQLADCIHKIDIDDLEGHMNTTDDKGEIFLKGCPMCKAPIINTRRCLDAVKVVMEEINKAKQIIYGDPAEIEKNRNVLMDEMVTLSVKQGALQQDCTSWFDAVKSIQEKLKPVHGGRRQMISLMDLDILKFKSQILTYLANDYRDVQTDKGREWIIKQINMITQIFCLHSNILSTQLQNDIEKEMQRNVVICQYIKIMRADSYKEAKNIPASIKKDRAVTKALFTYAPFDRKAAETLIQELQEILRTVVTKTERTMVVKAMNFTSGQWYRCPNSHLYRIENCGRAVMTSTCPECRSAIGGTNYVLAANNTPAVNLNTI